MLLDSKKLAKLLNENRENFIWNYQDILLDILIKSILEIDLTKKELCNLSVLFKLGKINLDD